MFSRMRDRTPLEQEIDRAIRELKNHPIGSEEYVRTLDAIVKLHGMKEREKPLFVSRDTLAVVGANLLGLLMVIKHENVNVITSRAFGLILKPRV